MNIMRVGGIIPLLFPLCAIVNVLHAEEDGSDVQKSIPSQNEFDHAFGPRCPGDVLVLRVVPDSNVTILSAMVKNPGSNAGWTGGPIFTGRIPDDYSGTHTGKFEGKYVYNGSGGPAVPLDWNGAANANVDLMIIKTRTIKTARDADDDRTKVGICEEVEFTTDPSMVVNWYATGGTPGTTHSASFIWTAPDSKADCTISASCGSITRQVTINVLEPAHITGTLDHVWTSEDLPPAYLNLAFAGMNVNLDFEPTTVSFGNCKWKEANVAPTVPGAPNYFALPANPPPNHTAPAPRQINDSNDGPFDQAAIAGLKPPYADGTFTWTIPEIVFCGATEHEIQKEDQVFTITAAGHVTVAKWGVNSDQAPAP